MGLIERFGHFEIAQGANAQPVELLRSEDEYVFLAFDTRIKRLVELHVLKSGERLRMAEKRSAFERAQLATGVHNASLIRILEVGEEGDVVYYSSILNDGEPLEAYIARRGALHSPTAFSLVMQLLDDLVQLQKTPRLLAELRLDRLFIKLQEETFLQLRVMDFGLSSPEQNLPEAEVAQRLVHELCRNIFLMLTGKVYNGEDCDKFTILTGLPSGLRSLLRTSLNTPENAPASIQRLREEVRDALMAQTRDLQGRVSRRHLVATDSMLPQSALREILLHDVRMEQLLKGRLVAEGQEAQQRYPFTFQGMDARTDAPLHVHLLPPRRIVSSEHYDAVPLQMWRFNEEKHPNILRSLSVWESPDLTFLTEERFPGFPLSRLIAERIQLNPAEVLIILRQVKSGLDQAMECGVEKLDIHPCNIFLKVHGTPHAREMEKLLQKRLDAWPKFTVMLRPHMTMRSLYEPLLVDAGAPTEEEDGYFDAKDFRGRSYVALAAYLLSGERHMGGKLRLPESVPNDLAAYVTESAERSRFPRKAPSPQEFLVEFENRAAVPEATGGAGGLVLPGRRGALREMTSSEPMESAGAVSDFDEDEPPTEGGSRSGGRGTGGTSLLAHPTVKIGPAANPHSRGRLGLVLWAAVFAVVVFIAYALFSGSEEKSIGTHPSPAPAPSNGPAPSPTSGPASKPTTPLPAPVIDPANPPINPATGKPMTPEEIRRALLPSEREKEELRKKQQDGKPQAGGAASGKVPPLVPGAKRFFAIQRGLGKGRNTLHTRTHLAYRGTRGDKHLML